MLGDGSEKVTTATVGDIAAKLAEWSEWNGNNPVRALVDGKLYGVFGMRDLSYPAKGVVLLCKIECDQGDLHHLSVSIRTESKSPDALPLPAEPSHDNTDVVVRTGCEPLKDQQ